MFLILAAQLWLVLLLTSNSWQTCPVSPGVLAAQVCLTLLPEASQAPLPWDSPGKNAGVGCHFLLQGIFLTQGSNTHVPSLLDWQAESFATEPPGKPTLFPWSFAFFRTLLWEMQFQYGIHFRPIETPMTLLRCMGEGNKITRAL